MLEIALALSGAASLIYEVVWARELALGLGDTAAAHAVVLASFLGGMALGNRLWGRRADLAPSPARLFAALELALAACGAVAPLLLPAAAAVSPLAAAVLVALPAAAMGGALPAAASAVGLGRMARLYGLSSLGACTGALLADFALVSALGLSGASWAAACLNLAAAGLAWRGGRARPAGTRAAGAEALFPPRLLAGVLLAGFASLLLEIGWIRLLALVLGSSVYSFSEMLAAFIAAISAGAFFAQRLRGGARAFALAQLAAAAGILLVMPLCDRLPFLFVRAAELLERVPENYPLYEALKFMVCLLMMLPAGASLGAALPLACQAAGKEAPGGRAAGSLLAASAVGNVAGALLGGLVLMPALGLQGLFALAAGLCLLAAAVGLSASPERSLPRPALGGLAAALALALWGGTWSRAQLCLGTFRLVGLKGLKFSTYREIFRQYRLLYQREDREASVAVMQFEDKQISLLINGKADASTGKDMRTQQLLAHVPLLLRPGARRGLVIGLGSGVTAGTALLHPLEALDVVEISPGVVEAAELFAPHNRAFRADPRLRLHVEDARAFVRGAGGGYDAIISEPSNPWMAGMGGLFSVEFYRRCRALLAPGGVMGQWLHVYEMSDEALAMVVRTFAAEFDRVELWHLYANDTVLVGFNGAPPEGSPSFESALARPAVSEDLGRIGLPGAAPFLALQMASDAGLRRLAGPGSLNRERFPRLEFDAPKAMFLKQTSDLFERGDEQGPSGALRLSRALAARRRPLASEESAAILAYHEGYRAPFLRRLLEDWSSRHPADPRPAPARARLELAEREPGAALAALREPLKRRSPGAEALDLAATAELELFAGGERAAAERAARHLEALARAPGADRAEAYARLGALRRQQGERSAALQLLERAAGLSAAPAELWLDAAELAWELDQGPRLVADLEMALKADPKSRRALDMLAYLSQESGKSR